MQKCHVTSASDWHGCLSRSPEVQEEKCSQSWRKLTSHQEHCPLKSYPAKKKETKKSLWNKQILRIHDNTSLMKNTCGVLHPKVRGRYALQWKHTSHQNSETLGRNREPDTVNTANHQATKTKRRRKNKEHLKQEENQQTSRNEFLPIINGECKLTEFSN